jgi:hypothetical protein
LKGATYQKKCQEVGLETHEERRKPQDMTQMLKILKGVDSVNCKIFFERREEQPWTGRKALRTHIRLNSYSVRVVKRWNSLPNDVKSLFKKSTPSERQCVEKWTRKWEQAVETYQSGAKKISMTKKLR